MTLNGVTGNRCSDTIIYFIYYIFSIFFKFFCFSIQSDASNSITPKSNKPKKLNYRRRIKKSPLWTVRQQTVDDQTGPRVAGEARTAALGAAMAISGPGSRNLMGQRTRGPGSQSAPTSPVATTSNSIPPPPNATVIVCVLAGTGRADLWVRNNRGQTPLDLCPADQPLRRALIKCCDAAARARSAQAAAATAASTESGTSPPAASKQWPQSSQLMLYNMPPDYSTKAPYRDAYVPIITADPGSPKKCFKRPNFSEDGLPDFTGEQLNTYYRLTALGLEYSEILRQVALVDPDTPALVVADNGSYTSSVSTTNGTTVNSDNENSNSVNSEDHDYESDIDFGNVSISSSSSSSSNMTNNNSNRYD